MNMLIKPLWNTLHALMILVLIMPLSCLKKNAELPPDKSRYDPQLTVTHTIRELKELNGFYDFKTGGDTTLISDDITISGIVTADDRSGNFYKRIVIEDSTGAIAVLVDGYNLYNDYPAGRRVYIRCRGLFLGYDGGLPVVGYTVSPQLSLTGMPTAQMSDFIVKGSMGHAVSPVVLSLTQVTTADPALYNRLICISEAEFSDTGMAFTQPNATTNREIVNCTGSKIAVRSSNYANFSGIGLPAGKGQITGIYTVYISAATGARTPQLVIRDTSDIHFYNPRCSSGPAPVVPMLAIDSLRKLASGSGTVSLAACRIGGVVISDRVNKNVDARNMILQDGKRGIVVRFSAVHSFNIGDSVNVDLGGAQLGRYNGLLQVGALLSGSTFQVSRVKKEASGKTVIPETAVIASFGGDAFEWYESTLVKIYNVSIAGGTTYSGNKSLTDASDQSGSLKLYTASGAVFSGQQIPAGEVNITGILGMFGSVRQLTIRSPADIE